MGMQLIGQGLLKLFGEQFSKSHTFDGTVQTGTYTVTLSASFPLNQSLIIPKGWSAQGTASTWYFECGMYLSGPNTVTIVYKGLGTPNLVVGIRG